MNVLNAAGVHPPARAVLGSRTWDQTIRLYNEAIQLLPALARVCWAAESACAWTTALRLSTSTQSGLASNGSGCVNKSGVLQDFSIAEIPQHMSDRGLCWS